MCFMVTRQKYTCNITPNREIGQNVRKFWWYEEQKVSKKLFLQDPRMQPWFKDSSQLFIYLKKNTVVQKALKS